ncbi:MAG: alpha/beta fold hydrolase [Myxococcales bacterium]
MERSILDALHGFHTRFVHAGTCALRVLEGGEGPPLVLLHGRGHAATIWFPLLPSLAARFRVLALDLPGFGSSAAPPFTGSTPQDALRYFADPLEHALRGLSSAPAAIVGHSLGAMCAVELALRRNLPLASLSLIGGMGLGPEMTFASRAFFKTGPERLARALGPRLFARMLPAGTNENARRVFELEYELLSVEGGRPEPERAFNLFFGMSGPAWNLQPRLNDLTLPVMLLWGRFDAAFPAVTAIEAASAIRQNEMHIESGGHAPHLERPAAILPLLLDFLGRTAGRQAT